MGCAYVPPQRPNASEFLRDGEVDYYAYQRAWYRYVAYYNRMQFESLLRKLLFFGVFLPGVVTYLAYLLAVWIIPWIVTGN